MRFLVLVGLVSIAAAFAHPSEADDRRSPVVEAVERIGPAVVNISTEQVIEAETTPFPFSGDPTFDRFFRDFFEPRRQRYSRSSLGSGVIIREDGHVLTNLHVVVRAARITVTLADEREFEAVLIGSDADSDIALLKVETEEPLPAVRMGSSDDLMIGETVIAIGNPFGLSHTVTTGVVSAAGRSLRTGGEEFYDLIQTDASINPGNSGGPLLNIKGELIGINTAIYRGAEGIGFATPIDRVKRITEDLLEFGELQPAWIGILAQDLQTVLRRRGEHQPGVLIQGVESESPADEAGLQPGDIIVKIGNHKVSTVDEWETRVRDYRAGVSIDLHLMRDGQPVRARLKAREFPVERADGLAWNLLGFHLRVQLGGLEVEAVRRGGAAAEIGIRPGDQIVGVEGRPVNDMEGFRRKLIARRNAQRVLISVKRGRRIYHVPMPLGGIL